MGASSRLRGPRARPVALLLASGAVLLALQVAFTQAASRPAPSQHRWGIGKLLRNIQQEHWWRGGRPDGPGEGGAARHGACSDGALAQHTTHRGSQHGASAEKQARHGRKLLVPILQPHTWQGHLVPERERHLGLLHAGDWARLRAAFARYHATGNLTVSVVGGSISGGAGAMGAHSWVEHLEDWLGVMFNASRDQLPPHHPGVGDPRVRVTNGAVPGTCSSYMTVCYAKHVAQDADVVIVEYALNDEHAMSFAPSPDYVQRGFERLLRKLLNYPRKPAVIILNAFSWYQVIVGRYDGIYTAGADAAFIDLASYYALPLLSVKACCYHFMLNGVKGFMVNRTRGDRVTGRMEPPEVDAVLKDTMFFWDTVHPNGETGHRAMADLVIELFHHVEKRLRRRPYKEEEEQHMAASKLPPPMLRENWESPSDKCFIGDTLRAIVDPTSDMQWANDVVEGRRPKFGFISNVPGHTLRFTIDTRAAATTAAVRGGPLAQPVITVPPQPGAQPAVKPPALTPVQVAHLKSYEGVGVAEITCVSGCACAPSLVNGTVDRRVSLVQLHEVMVTQHHACIMQVRVVGPGLPPGTAGSGTKFKVTGVMVPEPGPSQLSTTFAAMDLVTSAMTSSKTGTFELQNTLIPDVVVVPEP